MELTFLKIINKTINNLSHHKLVNSISFKITKIFMTFDFIPYIFHQYKIKNIIIINFDLIFY